MSSDQVLRSRSLEPYGTKTPVSLLTSDVRSHPESRKRCTPTGEGVRSGRLRHDITGPVKLLRSVASIPVGVGPLGKLRLLVTLDDDTPNPFPDIPSL